jgi:hypothetical protein
VLLPTLAANEHARTVLFLMNDFAGPGPLLDRAIPIGEVDGRVTARTRSVAAVLGSMRGFRAQIRRDMDARLKYHVALLTGLVLVHQPPAG